MRTIPRIVLALAFVAVGFATSPSRARAEWFLNGNPVCTAPGAQSNARCAPDGSGGAVILWTDERRGPGLVDLYATRILGDGTIAPGWPVDGVALTTSGNATSHSIVGDGAGGLLAFWVDRATYQAYMQHVDGSGALAPGFVASGMVLPISVGGPTGYLIFAVTDDAGGAFVMWNHFDGVADATYLSRVTGNGAFAPGWSASGVRQLTGEFTVPLPFAALGLAPDPSGGALTAAIAEIEAGGTPGAFTHSGPSGSAPTRNAMRFPPSALSFSMVADNAGGMFGAWEASTSPSPRMQHFLANGSSAWPEPTAAPVSDVLLRDGSGGIYLCGPSGSELQVHHRASDASIPSPWTAGGVVVSNAGPFTTNNAVLSGGLVYAAWSNGDVRASAITPDGAIAPGWAVNGDVVCDAQNTQVMTSMMAMPPTDALVVWADVRSGEPDVYASRLGPGGPPTLGVPPTLRREGLALQLAPNPSSKFARVSFTLPEAGPAVLELVDVGGRVLARMEPEPRAGAQALALETTGLPGGVYWARLRQDGRTTASRFAVVH